MGEKNLFWKGMFLGAIAGGALSLLDKQTRLTMKRGVQNTSSKLSYMVQNPEEITERVKGTALSLKTTIEQVTEDISIITGKVDELRDLTPQLMKETKNTFSDEADSLLTDETKGEKTV